MHYHQNNTISITKIPNFNLINLNKEKNFKEKSLTDNALDKIQEFIIKIMNKKYKVSKLFITRNKLKISIKNNEIAFKSFTRN